MELRERVEKTKEALLNPFNSDGILEAFSELQKALSNASPEEVRAVAEELKLLRELFERNRKLIEGFLKVGERDV
ncbi:MAG: hypothetical protein GXN96_04280 [Aquificae bacterium]|nr:hypothetical protein [Aquificota bacterium]